MSDPLSADQIVKALVEKLGRTAPETPRPPGIEGLKAAADLCNQVIVLSTGIITLSVTFVEKFRPEAGQAAASTPLTPWDPLVLAWLGFFVAIAFALVTRMAITGALDDLDRNPMSEARASSRQVTLPGQIMFLAFAGAMLCVIVSGWRHFHALGFWDVVLGLAIYVAAALVLMFGLRLMSDRRPRDRGGS